VQRRGPEIVRLGQIGAGVQQQPDQFGVPFVRGPVQRGVSVDVGQTVQSAHPEQEARRGRFAEHAGRHQRRQALEVRHVRVHSGLQNTVTPYAIIDECFARTKKKENTLVYSQHENRPFPLYVYAFVRV